MSKCEFCGSEHDGNYGSGRFCSARCASKYSNTFVSEQGRNNQIKALNNEENRRKSLNNIKIKNKSKKQFRNDLRAKFNHPLALGKIGELEVSKKFIEYGYDVYLPLIDSGNGIDIVVNNGSGFKTVQVKSTTTSNINENGECENSKFNIHKLQRNIHDGSYTQAKVKYDPSEVNYIALYSAYDDEAYLLKNTYDLPLNLTIRNIIPSNGQKKNIHLAKDYQIDKVLCELNLIHGVYYEDEKNIVDCEFTEIS